MLNMDLDQINQIRKKFQAVSKLTRPMQTPGKQVDHHHYTVGHHHITSIVGKPTIQSQNTDYCLDQREQRADLFVV